MTRRTKLPAPPTHFAILVSPRGCVIASVYPEYVRDLVKDVKPGWSIENVDRAEWKARAEPCLRGACSHWEAL